MADGGIARRWRDRGSRQLRRRDTHRYWLGLYRAGVALATQIRARRGGPASIVAKLPAAGDELRRSWWAGYLNEWRFYRDLAGSIPLRTPRYLGGAGDESSGLAVTLLEDLDGSTSRWQEVGATLPLAEAVIEALASLHSTFWQSDRPEGAAWLASAPSAAAAALAQYIRTGAPHLARYAEGDPAIPRGLIDLAPMIHEAVAQASLRLGTAPQTLIHGDMRPDTCCCSVTTPVSSW